MKIMTCQYQYLTITQIKITKNIKINQKISNLYEFLNLIKRNKLLIKENIPFINLKYSKKAYKNHLV